MKLRDRLTFVIPALSAYIVAMAAFTLSFVALSEVAAEVGAVPENLSWLVPVVVDGGILAGSASLWAASYRQRSRDKVAYLTVIFLLGFSVVVNASHAADSLMAKAIAALPPLVLLATLELVASAHRRDVPLRKSAPKAAHVVTAAKPAVKKAVAKVPSASVGTRADDVRSVFDEMVLAGVDPADPSITNAIAEKVSVSPAYVRRLIKPMREDSLDRNPAL